ncbi:MAG: hypothetical protein DRJ09_11075, partial [Bacteroidetes bacterium]
MGAYLSPYINPNHISLFAFFGLSYPILLYLNLAFVIVWLLVKRKLALLSLVLIMAGYPMLHRYVQLFPSKTTSDQNGLKVMSYNVRNFQQLGTKNKNSTKTAMVKLIEQRRPDIICF